MHDYMVEQTSRAVQFADKKTQHDHELSLDADNEVLYGAILKCIFGCSCDFRCDRVAICLQLCFNYHISYRYSKILRMNFQLENSNPGR